MPKAEGKSTKRWTTRFSTAFMAFQGYWNGLARLLLRVSPIKEICSVPGQWDVVA
jgi:hypothetical protein